MWGVRYLGDRGSSGGRLGAISYHWNLRLRLGWAVPYSKRCKAGWPSSSAPRRHSALHSAYGPSHSLELTVIDQVLCIGEIQHLVSLG